MQITNTIRLQWKKPWSTIVNVLCCYFLGGSTHLFLNSFFHHGLQCLPCRDSLLLLHEPPQPAFFTENLIGSAQRWQRWVTDMCFLDLTSQALCFKEWKQGPTEMLKWCGQDPSSPLYILGFCSLGNPIPPRGPWKSQGWILMPW